MQEIVDKQIRTNLFLKSSQPGKKGSNWGGKYILCVLCGPFIAVSGPSVKRGGREGTGFIVALTIFQSHSDWNKIYQAKWLDL